MSDVNLTDTEREALLHWLWENHSGATTHASLCAEVEKIAARVRAAALAPIQALAANLDRCGHGRHEGEDCAGCFGPSRGNPQDVVIVGFAVRGAPITVADLRSVLAAAGVDAAPNETTTEGATHPAHWKRHGHEGTPCPPGGGCYGGADYRAAVPSGHEQDGDHR